MGDYPGHYRRGSRLVAAATAVVLLAAGLPAAGAVITGTCDVVSYGDPGFPGYWQYCVDVQWDTAEMGGHGMSFVNLLIGLGYCPCACSPDLILFGDVAGTGLGEGGCELEYAGIFDCRGDPNFPDLGPSVKFEYIDNGCEPGETGSAHVCFYSAFGPGEHKYHTDVLGIKASTSLATGDMLGVLPVCVCGSPVEGASWGVVKALYR
jgi:hypothetical protein